VVIGILSNLVCLGKVTAIVGDSPVRILNIFIIIVRRVALFVSTALSRRYITSKAKY